MLGLGRADYLAEVQRQGLADAAGVAQPGVASMNPVPGCRRMATAKEAARVAAEEEAARVAAAKEQHTASLRHPLKSLVAFLAGWS